MRHQRDDGAEHGHQHARQHEQVRRAVDEQEAQVPPAVAEARQLGLAAARAVLDRELADVELLLRGPDDHLGGELHPGRAQVQPGQHVAADRPHAAVRVADAGAEQEVEDAGQDRVADVAVQPRHGAGMDVVHPVAHHELGAGLELLDEARDLVEVVGEVGVGHHDVAAAGGGEAGEVRAAVAASRLASRRGRRRRRRARRSGPPTRCRRRRPRPRCRCSASTRARAGDAVLDVRRLVQARDDDRDDDLVVAGSAVATGGVVGWIVRMVAKRRPIGLRESQRDATGEVAQ